VGILYFQEKTDDPLKKKNRNQIILILHQVSYFFFFETIKYRILCGNKYRLFYLL